MDITVYMVVAKGGDGGMFVLTFSDFSVATITVGLCMSENSTWHRHYVAYSNAVKNFQDSSYAWRFAKID